MLLPQYFVIVMNNALLSFFCGSVVQGLASWLWKSKLVVDKKKRLGVINSP